VDAAANDFGIAITLIAVDSSCSRQMVHRGSKYARVARDTLSALPGAFIINFGEMMELWTDVDVAATPYRAVNGTHERMSLPMFSARSFTRK